MMDNCIMCKLIEDKTQVVCENEYAVAIYDGYPVGIGHTLVVPKRHVESLFELTQNELNDICSLIVESKNVLDSKYHPNGYNIGVNEGRAAGRTVDHVHIHIIPRYVGDVEDPRGGIRGVIPDKKIY